MTETAGADALSSAGGPQAASVRGWVLPLVVLVAGVFMSIMDISVINVALPTIQNEFGATTSDVQWVITGYALAEGVVVPVSAWFGDRFGLSQVYIVAMLGFTGGSVLCGLAWSLDTLVIFRIVQGLLGGLLPAITMSILLRIVPPSRLGTALGLYGLGVVFAPAVGPALGGYLVEYVNWRLIFFINVPVGILGAIAAVLVLPGFPKRVGQRFDLLGFVTVATGLFALLLAVSKGEDWRWSSYRILGLITISVLSLALFVVIELEVDDPLLDLRVFRYWAFTHSLLLIVLLSGALLSIVFLVPQFLQQGQGLGALDAGLILLPPALVMAVLMPITGRIYDRFGPRWPATIGLVIAATASYQLRTISLDTPRGEIMWVLVLLYAGLGIGMMPIFSAGLAVIPTAQASVASALNNVVQRAAAAFGVAGFTAILTVLQAHMMAGRAALLPATTPTPHLGPAGTPDWVGLYALYQQTHQQVFVASIGNLFLLVAALFVLSALGSLLLRSGPAPATPPGLSPPATQASSPAPADVGAVGHAAVERDSVSCTNTGNASLPQQPDQLISKSTLLPATPDQPPALAELITVTGPTAADPHATSTEATEAPDESLADTKTAQQTPAQATGEQAEQTAPTVQAKWDHLSEQLPAPPQQSTDLATAHTEPTARHEQDKQQPQRAEATEQQVIPAAGHIEHLSTELATTREQLEHQRAQAAELTTARPEPTPSPIIVGTARNHREPRRLDQQTRARSRTSGQKPKLGPRQVALAQQMFDEFDRNGQRRYTIQQIADAFGVTPAELGVELQCFPRRSAATTASGKAKPSKAGLSR
ncbi:MAG: DHA2 family efflux MFS transporter permease subunit [Pseudonocardiaceae bacterium]